MEQVLEYISKHYTLFLAVAILILLAIIGYYADKTNFGQGKTNEKNPDEEPKGPSDVGLSDAISTLDKQSNEVDPDKKEQLNDLEAINSNQKELENLVDVQTIENITDKEIGKNSEVIPLEFSNKNYLDVNDKTKNENITAEDNIQIPNISKQTFGNQVINNNVNFPEDNSNLESDIVTQEDDSLLNDEVFNKFNEEFNLILPKKELINTDLLSDIDDLEFDKTQKIDLSGIPDLDDIELPKIKNLVSEEEDIWKF